MIRQIDTGIGLIVGGIIGWFHHGWIIWLTLFGVLVLWYYLGDKTDALTTSDARRKK